jgi:signal transduction histidine kinase
MRAVTLDRDGIEAPSPRWLLVVDDSEAEREIIALTLGAAFPGAQVRSVSHPYAGRAMCEEQRFDCVLVDYNMPDMNGLALARELKGGDPHLPIILITSVGDEMLAAEALRAGISDYIPKSRITADSITRTVGRSMHGCAQARLIEEQRGELENFAYALAHDFKQPIRQITTFAQMIAEEIGGDGTVQEHLTFLGDAAGRLGKLVDVMSQYTLLNQAPDLADVDLNDMVASVRTSLAPYLAECRGEFVASLQGCIIRGNETLMTQVVQNLVMNGLRYNRSSAPRVELTMQRDGEHCVIKISDNGIGIAAEYLAEIFKPLVRLHNASEFPGSGLGLTLARKAVVTQGGAIWCESDSAHGSVFHVRLPAAAGSEMARAVSA